MKNIRTLFISLSLLLTTSSFLSAQVNTTNEREVLNYLDQNKFETNIDGSVVYVTYGYISAYNTYGLIVGNNSGNKNYFINATVKIGYSYATVSGMNMEGQDFTVEVYSSGSVTAGGLNFKKVRKSTY